MMALDSPTVAAALLNALWQGSLIAVATLAVLRVLSLDARERYGVLLLALCATASAPVINVYQSSSELGVSPSDTSPTVGPASQVREVSRLATVDLESEAAANASAVRDTVLQLPAGHWVSVAWIFWALMSACSVHRLFVSAASLGRLESRSTPAPSVLERRLERWCAQLHVRQIEVRLSPDVQVPLSIGLGRRLILLPKDCGMDWSEKELDAILLHEAAHLCRGDDWTNLVSRLVLALLPFHPAVVALEKRLRAEREVASDMLALRWFGSAQEYGSALIAIAQRFTRATTPAPVLTHAMASSSKLSDRIQRIQKGDSAMNPLIARFVLPTTALILSIAVLSCSKNPRVEVVASRPTVATPSAVVATAHEPKPSALYEEHIARTDSTPWAHQEHRAQEEALRHAHEAREESRRALRQAQEEQRRTLRELRDERRRAARAQRDQLRELKREKQRAIRALRGEFNKSLREKLRANRNSLRDNLRRMREELRNQLRSDLDREHYEEVLERHEQDLEREAEAMEETLHRELEQMERELELNLEHLERELESTLEELDSLGRHGAEVLGDVLPEIVDSLPIEEIVGLGKAGALAAVEGAIVGLDGLLTELEEAVDTESEEDDSSDANEPPDGSGRSPKPYL